MVVNEFIHCNSCKTLINLRAQAGYSSIPFSIDCPTCGSNISGDMDQIGEHQFGLVNIENADRTSADVTNLADSFYSFELSTEFLTRKVIQKDPKKLFELSPFLRNVSESTFTYTAPREAYKFYNYVSEDKWSNLQNLINLNLHDKQEYVLGQLNEQLKTSISAFKSVSSPLEVTMALHQMLLTDSGLSFIIGKSELSNYTDYAQKIYAKRDFVIDYVKQNYSDLEIQMQNFNQDFMALINEFSRLYKQFIPIVIIKANNSINKIDLEKMGLTTLNYEQINAFYAHTYEFILKNLNIIFIFNNLFSRGDALKYPKGKSLEDFNKIGAYNRLSELISSEPFSRPVKSLKNKVRNAIAHYDVSVNRNNQLITYRDRKKSETLYYAELANLCLENLSLAFYLNELFYTVEKFKALIDGTSFDPKLK